MGMFDNNGGGALDPATMGLLSAAFAGLQASGPSRMPVSFGQVLGNAGQAGVGAYMQTQQQNAQQALSRAHVGLLEQQIRRAKAESDFTDQLINGGLLGGGNGNPLASMNADQLEALGARAALFGHPGAATLVNQAEKLRAAQQAREQVQSFREAPGVLGAGVTTNSPQGGALMSNLTGDPDFDRAVLSAQNEALNSNARPGVMPARPVTAPRTGLFEPLINSPYVGNAARTLQNQLNSVGPNSGISPQVWLQHFERLQGLHSAAANQAAARQDTADLRRDLAGQSDQTRRDIANMSLALRNSNAENSTENRRFTQERQLAENYNTLSKDFRKVLPQFQSAAQYVAGGKYDSSGDRALVFQYAKTLDPQDRVGVNDIKDIGKLGNVPERVVQAVESLAEGKTLPDRVRAEMFNVMRNRFAAMNEQQNQIEDEYTERARRYMLRPDNVVIRYGVRDSGGGGGGNGWSIKPVTR